MCSLEVISKCDNQAVGDHDLLFLSDSQHEVDSSKGKNELTEKELCQKLVQLNLEYNRTYKDLMETREYYIALAQKTDRVDFDVQKTHVRADELLMARKKIRTSSITTSDLHAPPLTADNKAESPRQHSSPSDLDLSVGQQRKALIDNFATSEQQIGFDKKFDPEKEFQVLEEKVTTNIPRIIEEIEQLKSLVGVRIDEMTETSDQTQQMIDRISAIRATNIRNHGLPPGNNVPPPVSNKVLSHRNKKGKNNCKAFKEELGFEGATCGSFLRMVEFCSMIALICIGYIAMETTLISAPVLGASIIGLAIGGTFVGLLALRRKAFIAKVIIGGASAAAICTMAVLGMAGLLPVHVVWWTAIGITLASASVMAGFFICTAIYYRPTLSSFQN